MGILWLVDQVTLLLSGSFGSWNLGFYMGFYPNPYAVRHQPWSILTYPWFHTDLLSLGVNILSLYALARLWMGGRGQGKHYLMTFLWGSLWGAALYGVAVWLGVVASLPLYGASAGVCALAFRLAMAEPRRQVIAMGLRMNFLVLILLIYTLTTLLSGQNLGGVLAHLGGAVYGILLVYRSWLHPKPPHNGQARADKNTHKPTRTRAEQEGQSREQALIQRKLRESGYKSLSPQEQEKL